MKKAGKGTAGGGGGGRDEKKEIRRKEGRREGRKEVRRGLKLSCVGCQSCWEILLSGGASTGRELSCSAASEKVPFNLC